MTVSEKSNSLFIKNFNDYISNLQEALGLLPLKDVNNLADLIYSSIISSNSIFIAGNGGSFANSMHIAADFSNTLHLLGQSSRFLSLGSNPAQITATANDHGLKKIFVNYLKVSKLNKKDLILIFSVGGGNYKRKSSLPIIEAVKYAKKINCPIVSLTGKKNGYASKNSNLSITFKVKDKFFLTPVSETLQSFLWHYLVTDPRLQVTKTFW